MIWTLLGTAAVAMVISLATYVSAFEANTINITSFVQQPFQTQKTFVAAVLPNPATADFDTLSLYHQNRDADFGDLDIDCDGSNDDADIANNEFPELGSVDNCYDPGTAFPIPGVVDVVRAGVIVCWDLTLLVTNDTGVEITQVVVRDKFSSEVNGVPMEDLPVVVNPVNFGKGKGHKKKPSNAALEITWWVDYLPFSIDDYHNGAFITVAPPEEEDSAFTPEGDIDDNDGNKRTPARGSSIFGIGASETALMLACTDRNPADKQSYTSTGCYTLNSGLNVKGLTLETGSQGQHFQMSFSGDPLFVWAAFTSDELSNPDFSLCE